MDRANARIADEHGNIYFVDVADLEIKAGFLGPTVVNMTGYLREHGKAQKKNESAVSMKASKVVFHPPATAVIWEDGTKTVVKCDAADEYDPRYGLALCYMKKALGNTSRGLNDALRAGLKDVRTDSRLPGPELEKVREMLKTDSVVLRENLGYSSICPVCGSHCHECPYMPYGYNICQEALRRDIKIIKKEERKND